MTPPRRGGKSLHYALALVTNQTGASMLCPCFVPPRIADSERNRPPGMRGGAAPTRSQHLGMAIAARAVGSGKVSASVVAQRMFEAVREQHFYVYGHLPALAGLQLRMHDTLQSRNPTDPSAHRPEPGAELRAALREAS